MDQRERSVPDGAKQTGGLSQAQHRDGVPVHFPSSCVEKREALPSQLSGGQQQRAAIARALVMSPSVLLADEPTGNLDKASRNGVMELFRRLNDIYQVTILMVTHDEELARQCDRILYMDDGQIIRDRF